MVSASVMTVNASLLRFSCWFELIKETVSNSCLSVVCFYTWLGAVFVFLLFILRLSYGIY
ncbi:unnamed protein product [Brassica rapa]|uniref:Uncharacterized protein n=2 Tax=Brassica TaxID=3705 RepID=A0A8D9G7K0_BRACM|nr:unnamed protein product [Brassica napus]CAG7872220.1 unnamed protein product [Brassica rapa]